MSAMSTKEDEVILQVDLVKEVGDHFETETLLFEEFKFTDSLRLAQLALTLPLPEGLEEKEVRYLVFSLVELDERNSQRKLKKILRTAIEKAWFLDKTHHLALDNLLGDDDLLGMKFLRFSHLKYVESRVVKFEGRHLFDRYEYQLRYLLKDTS